MLMLDFSHWEDLGTATRISDDLSIKYFDLSNQHVP